MFYRRQARYTRSRHGTRIPSSQPRRFSGLLLIGAAAVTAVASTIWPVIVGAAGAAAAVVVIVTAVRSRRD
jgi:hypothetical protein